MTEKIKTIGKVIRVHQDLINILEELRNRINEFTDGGLNKNLSYYDLSILLSKKINKLGGIVKPF